MTPLRGRIVHRLELQGCSSDVTSKKRRRDHANKRPDDAFVDKPSQSLSAWRSADFFFLPTATNSLSQDEFLLSLPQRLVKMACDAARYRWHVKVLRFSIIPLVDSNDDVGGNSTAIIAAKLLQVHQMELLESHADSSMKLPQDVEDVWTLSQFQRKEYVDAQAMKTVERHDTYHIIGKVDAISPIIAMDPSDPFCLMEIYDEYNASAGCVVVLKGVNALSCHAGILPGDDITFRRVVRKAWPVPEMVRQNPAYEYLGSRIPSHVFVVTEARSIMWDPCTETLPPVPFTPVPLISLRGKIGHVERMWMPRGNGRVYTIHWLELIQDAETETIPPCTHVLYLTHFPLSPSMQLSLIPGARAQATNIHLLSRSLEPGVGSILGACLRSSISLLDHQYTLEDDSFTDSEEHLGTQQLTAPVPPRSMVGVVPYSFSKIRRTYRDYLYRKRCKEWIFTCFPKDRSAATLPTSEDVLASCLLKDCKTALLQSERFEDAQDDTRSDHSLNATGHLRKSSARNPYAEFFDHALDDSEDRAPYGSCGCDMSIIENCDQQWPHFIGLDVIRSKSSRVLADRLVDYLELPSTSIFGGWTSSIHITKAELLKALLGDNESKGQESFHNQPLYTGGFACVMDSDCLSPSSIRDSHCQLPASFSGMRLESESADCAVGDFALGRMDTVIVSCLCLSTPKTRATRSSHDTCEYMISRDEVPLPPLSPGSYTTVADLQGGCSIMKIAAHYFVVSVQLRCNSFICIESKSISNAAVVKQRNAQQEIRSIEECLVDPSGATVSTGSTPIFFNGILVRQRYRYAKVNTHNKLCNCCVLTLSSAPTQGDFGEPSLSSIQSIELKVAIRCDSSKRLVFKRALSQLLGDVNILDDHVVLGLSWWSIADYSETCALVAGGWDELERKSDASATSVRVRLPVSAITLASRGYVRFAGGMNEIKASFLEVASSHTRDKMMESSPAFDFVGSAKYVDGMLDRRPPRRLVFGNSSPRIIGELWSSPSNAIPASKLSDLFQCLCHDLRSQSQTQLAPSLVRQVIGARFLGVSFCEAKCICTRCYQQLVDTRNKKNAPQAQYETSFWHVPLPILNGTNTNLTSNLSHGQVRGSSELPAHIRNSTLHCPKGCPLECSTVKWECSGILDDGTGQAKLYAERDAALTLLGMSAEVIEWIEQGAWSKATGVIRFQKSIPPPQYIQQAVRTALSKTKKGHSQDAFQFLSPDVRADYLLQYHCRSSPQPQRELDYLVRCKPLADSARHLNQTHADTFFPADGTGFVARGEAPSYSLPPLKLHLVDCCISSDS
jgi:hypothetical protein